MGELESRIVSENPNHVDVTSIEEMLLLYLWIHQPFLSLQISAKLSSKKERIYN